jgi:hypothetical protein
LLSPSQTEQKNNNKVFTMELSRGKSTISEPSQIVGLPHANETREHDRRRADLDGFQQILQLVLIKPLAYLGVS